MATAILRSVLGIATTKTLHSSGIDIGRATPPGLVMPARRAAVQKLSKVVRRGRLCLMLGFALIWSTSPVGGAASGGSSSDESGVPRVLRVGSRQVITNIASAARLARNGDTVEVDAGDYLDDVASWPQDDLTIRAVGGRARMISVDARAENKALWVIKGNRVVIENIEFTGVRVADRNGAGIRHEGGKLTVRNCLFERNEMGLLTWNSEVAELVVEASEFRDNGVSWTHQRGDPIGHQIYVGTIARFTLRESYVHAGAFGHLVKTRARENFIVNNRIADEASGKASYELEFPNGGVAYVLGNIIQQSAHTENFQLISYGAEGYRWPQSDLFLVNNTLVDDVPRGGAFLRVTPGAGRVVLINNLLLGNAILEPRPDWESDSNQVAQRDDMVSAATGDYRLRAASSLVGKAIEPGSAHGRALRLEREYVHPLQSRPLPEGPLNPGALQSVSP